MKVPYPEMMQMPETMKTLLDQTRALLLWAALAVSACSTTPPPAPEVTTAPFDSALSAVVGVYANIPEDARRQIVLASSARVAGF